MSNVLKHRGYFARIEYDAEDNLFHGRIANIEDGVGFHAESTADLIPAFHEAVDDYIETCRRIGREPQRPYSGQVMVRIAPEIHAGAATAAALAGVSMTAWIAQIIRQAVTDLDLGTNPEGSPAPSGRASARRPSRVD